MMMAAKRKKVSLRDEPQPDPRALRRIDEVEESGNVRWSETAEDPETGEEVEVEREDRSGCDLGGMTIEEYGELLRAMLPGYVHGYSPGLDPDSATPKRPPVSSLLADDADSESAPVRPECLEYVRCLQRRVRLGMTLHRAEDYPRRES